MRPPGYVYVLHFDAKLAHAQHYIGCTTDPRTRMIAHAAGRSAKIMAALKQAGIGFRLAALGQTPVARMRTLERQVKNWHNAREFCTVCQFGQEKAIPGTRAYPLEVVPFALDSATLATLAPGEPSVCIHVSTDEDVRPRGEDVRRIMREEKDCLGFIPAGGQSGLTESIARGWMILTMIDGVLGGYLAFTESQNGFVKIQQCVIRDAYRRNGYARRMVEELKRVRPGRALQAKVRDDLPANEFWTAIGFAQVSCDTHETSGAKLNIYQWFPNTPQTVQTGQSATGAA